MLENNIETLINNFINQNATYFTEISNASFELKVKRKNDNLVVIKFNVTSKNQIFINLKFSKVGGVYQLDVTDGKTNTEGLDSIKRTKIFTELDMLCNRLNHQFLATYKSYY